jgi:hypothetical protein
MSQRHWLCIYSVLVLALATQGGFAEEPNEFFGESTVLAPGVLFVEDDLSSGGVTFPDTLLGARDLFGNINYDYVDDDGSPVGDGYASGMVGVPTNSGSISFAVSGYGDDDFFGNHGEFGDYEVFIDAYDFFGDLVDSFSETATLQPGNVDEYSYSNFEWLNGYYDVYIDNTVGGLGGADVDFFTFTGLSPGSMFTAEVVQETATNFDSVLGWFDEVGNLIDSDDDGGIAPLSLLEGIVPSSGTLTFAVTGFDDFDFLGNHAQDADYALQLTIGGGEVTGDFDGDSDVDGQDFLAWQRNTSVGDLADWQANYGIGALAAVTVPEPGGLGLLALAGLWRSRKR